MGVSLESEKNTQKLDCCYHTTVKLLKIIHLKSVNIMVCRLYLNKAFFFFFNL